MGLGRWWMTHGPGSAGSIAKAMAKAYSRIKAAYPGSSKGELLFMTLRSCYSETQLDDGTAIEIVRMSEGYLAALTLQVVLFENPAARGARLQAPEVYAEMLEILKEVTAEFAPGS